MAGQASHLMFYFYLLKSESHPGQTYAGSTCDLRRRLTEHSEGRCSHIGKFRSWVLLAYIAFMHAHTAIAFEKHLTSGSGAHSSSGTLRRIVFPVYLWRKRAELKWLKAREDLLQAHAHNQLVIVQKPGRRRLDLEIVCRSRSDSAVLLKK